MEVRRVATHGAGVGWRAAVGVVLALAATAAAQTGAGASTGADSRTASPPLAGRASRVGGSDAAQLRAETPAPGRLIRVAGFVGRQHLWCRGPHPMPGVPTVVVISGAGDFSLSWRQVQARLAQRHRVCTYDRASLGWSGRSTKPRTGRHIVTELRRLLRTADVTGPLVVVGHSMGGIYARMFAARYADRVQGVVLVDPGDEHLPTAISPLARRELRAGILGAARAQQAGGRVCAAGAYARQPRLLALATVLPHRDALIDRRLQAAWCRTWRGTAAEGLGAHRTWAQARRLRLGAGSLGDRPLAIVVSDADLTFVADPAVNRSIVRRWRALQRAQRALSADSRFRVARGASHLVMLDRADSVVSAARWVLARA